MRRMVQVLLVAAAAAGCAAPSTAQNAGASLGALRADVGALRAEMAAASRTQDELRASDLGRTLAQLEALEARTQEVSAAVRETLAEVERLRARVEATEARVARGAEPSASPLLPAPAPRVESPERMYAAALGTFRSGEHGQAILEFLDFIARHPGHPLAANARYWIGDAYYAQRDYRQALAEFEKLLDQNATSAKAPDALLKAGFCLERLRDVRRAQLTWQRVVREYPGSEAAVRARSLLRPQGMSAR